MLIKSVFSAVIGPLSLSLLIGLQSGRTETINCYECYGLYNDTDPTEYMNCNDTSIVPKKVSCTIGQCFETFGKRDDALDDDEELNGWYILRNCSRVTPTKDNECESFNEKDSSGQTAFKGRICRCGEDLCNNHTDDYTGEGNGARWRMQPDFKLALFVNYILGYFMNKKQTWELFNPFGI